MRSRARDRSPCRVSSELQPGGARAIGDFLHAAVIRESRCDRRRPRVMLALLAELRDALADLARRAPWLPVGAPLERDASTPATSVRPLSSEMTCAYMCRLLRKTHEPRPLVGAAHAPAHARLAALARRQSSVDSRHRCYLPPAPAALPALRRMRSSAYLMPFPLYGSGGRSARICAAHLAEHLPVVALERHDHLPVDLGVDARRQLIDDRMRVAEAELHRAALRPRRDSRRRRSRACA